MSGAPDFAVIGGGIVGCSLAAFLAEAGASVVLYEREAIAAGASGRNSGVVQHPFDAALVDLYEESLEHYRTLGRGFTLPEDPVGLLLVSEEPTPAPDEFPELQPAFVEGAELRALEPALAEGLVAWRLETGRPVPPAAAAKAFALRAHEAGATLQVGQAAHPVVADGRATGVTIDSAHHPAGAVVLAAGPWTPVESISPLWGVVVEYELPDAPRHVLEEAGIDGLTKGQKLSSVLFSAVTARGISAIGSSFTPDEPDGEALTREIVRNATRFLPAREGVEPGGMRACARPISEDGRPLLGPLPEVEGLAIASGHGAWGITLGPASSRRVADQLLGRRSDIPPDLAAERIRRRSGCS